MSEYAELLCCSNFSFLRGASHPKELVERASALGYAALGIADEASLSGVVRAHQAAEEAGMKLLVGARFQPADGPETLLYVRNRQGYSSLCRLITKARRRAAKGSYQVYLADFEEFKAGLLAVVPALKRAARQRMAQVLEAADLTKIQIIFGEDCYLAITRHLGSRDQQELEDQFELAESCGVLSIAANDVHIHEAARKPLLDVVTAIREGTTVREAGWLLFANGERYLKEPSRIEALFAEYPEAIARTLEVASKCEFSLNELKYEYPHHDLVPEGKAATTYLAELTQIGAAERYPQGIPGKVQKLIEKELVLIGELEYEGYFLTVWDIVRFARSVGILCQGRGSAANSAVCFCLGITSVDPEHGNLLFERFISKERHEPPDIDVDFENARREEVFQYIYNKYGRERAGLTANVITYRRKSALREVSKVLGFSLDMQDALTKGVHSLSNDEIVRECLREAGLDPHDRTLRLVIRLARELRGFPRHLSQHVGGFVITKGRLDDLVPIENAAMEDRTVVQWNKDDLDALGILKIDCLALGMLTAVQKCFALLRKHHGVEQDLAAVLATDHKGSSEASGVYDMICEGDTVGVFQIESRAQMQMLPRLRPRCFYDLVIEVAIIRPGPIVGKMVHPYLNRRNGEEEIIYPHAITKPILERTLGIPLFQEQVMALAVTAAGYTPGEADKLRKAMAAWKRTGQLDVHREKLISGMLARGIAPEFAERVFDQIKGFSEYGFPESHSASFALIVYVSCYLKRYYPAAFGAALLNAMPLGFYQPTSIVRDVKEHGVEVRAPDVNASAYDSTLEEASEGIPSDEPQTWGLGGPSLRLGLREIRGLKEAAAERLMEARRVGCFKSVDDFARRTRLDRGQLTKLAEAGAFASLGVDRRQALWQVKVREELTPLLRDLPSKEPQVHLAPMTLDEQVMQDYASYGLSLRAHPIGLVRDLLRRDGLITSQEMRIAPSRSKVEIAGIVLCRQRPGTASGVLFMTLEDEAGVANVIIWPSVFETHRRVARLSRVLRIRGEVQRDKTGKVVNLIAESLAPLNAAAAAAQHIHSRDFH